MIHQNLIYSQTAYRNYQYNLLHNERVQNTRHVLEHSGMKVSNLYIAQVKQKCGIIERENYNKPKAENAKQPQCPPEKEKAIMEAFEYFGMI